MNCMIVGGEAECRQLLRSYIEKKPELLLAVEANSAAQARKLLDKNKIDVLFLDAALADAPVMDFIGSLKQLPLIVLISHNKEHAADAFELDVVDFLCKPVGYERFSKAIHKVFAKHKERKALTSLESFIYIKSDSRIVKISFQDILFIEAMADYMMIYTSMGKHIMHSTMKALEQKLPRKNFLRVHRSYIVNLDNITQVKDQLIYMDAKSIPIGTTYREKLISRIPVI